MSCRALKYGRLRFTIYHLILVCAQCENNALDSMITVRIVVKEHRQWIVQSCPRTIGFVEGQSLRGVRFVRHSSMSTAARWRPLINSNVAAAPSNSASSLAISMRLSFFDDGVVAMKTSLRDV